MGKFGKFIYDGKICIECISGDNVNLIKELRLFS